MTKEAEAPPAVKAENVEQVNVAPAGPSHLPYVAIIATVTFSVLIGFAIVTFWVLSSEPEKGVDAATKGMIVQAWISIATAAVFFWVGSSLGGKMQVGSRAPEPRP